jgi:hypothetical protein
MGYFIAELNYLSHTMGYFIAELNYFSHTMGYFIAELNYFSHKMGYFIAKLHISTLNFLRKSRKEMASPPENGHFKNVQFSKVPNEFCKRVHVFSVMTIMLCKWKKNKNNDCIHFFNIYYAKMT